MVDRLKSVVGAFELNADVEDQIVWVHDSEGEFLIKKLSYLLSTEGLATIDFPFLTIYGV